MIYEFQALSALVFGFVFFFLTELFKLDYSMIILNNLRVEENGWEGVMLRREE